MCLSVQCQYQPPATWIGVIWFLDLFSSEFQSICELRLMSYHLDSSTE